MLLDFLSSIILIYFDAKNPHNPKVILHVTATPKEEITKLKKYKNLNIKIDLEPPIPKFKYSNLKMLFYIIKLYFMKYQNSEYLHKTISEISKDNKGQKNQKKGEYKMGVGENNQN